MQDSHEPRCDDEHTDSDQSRSVQTQITRRDRRKRIQARRHRPSSLWPRPRGELAGPTSRPSRQKRARAGLLPMDSVGAKGLFMSVRWETGRVTRIRRYAPFEGCLGDGPQVLGERMQSCVGPGTGWASGRGVTPVVRWSSNSTPAQAPRTRISRECLLSAMRRARALFRPRASS